MPEQLRRRVTTEQGRSAISNVDRHRLDEAYVEEWSLRKDAKLLLLTPIALLMVHRSR